jgi:F-type H+-transporting ATPase subunit a
MGCSFYICSGFYGTLQARFGMLSTYFKLLVFSLFIVISGAPRAWAQHASEHPDTAHSTHQSENVHADTNHGDAHATEGEAEFDAAAMIMHHIADSHEFHAWGEGEKGFTLPLPVILLTKNGLVSFLSSEFHHDDEGKHLVERGGQRFVKVHDKIYYAENQADSHGSYVVHGEDHSVLNAKPLDFSITKNVFSLLMSALLLLVLFIPAARSYARNNGVPRGLAGFLEPLIVFVRDDIARPNIGEHRYAKFMPYLLTAFFFIWINNLIGLIPIFPFSANLTGNIAVTFTLAFFTLIITNISANKGYWKHIFLPHVPLWLYPIMVPVEIIGILSKPFALMIRLFANISAGHIIILSLVSLIFIFKSVAISPVSVAFVLFMNFIELLVAALQAYIFTLLSALFIGLAHVEEEAHH